MNAELGHIPSRVYISEAGNLHLNGAQIKDSGEAAVAQGVTITPAKGGSANICLVTFQVVDGAGNAIAAVFNLDVWLSDAATGAGLTGTTASGAVTVGAKGAVVGTYTAKEALRLQTDATGAVILSITDTAKSLFVPCCNCPGTGKTIAGAALVAGNYD